MSKKDEKPKLVMVGVIGAFISAAHSKYSGVVLSTDLVEATKMALPLVSFALYLGGVWFWESTRPQAAEIVKGRRQSRKAIKQCDKLLRNPDLTEEHRKEIVAKRHSLELGVVDSLAK